MTNSKLYSAALVAAQMILIVIICTRALPAKPGAAFLPATLLIVSACILAVAALITLRLSNLSVMPEPVKEGELITSGPYKFIRHPMYTAVLLGCAGMLVLNFSTMTAVLWAALCVVLTLKIQREEALLQMAYPRYNEYRTHTGALLPKFTIKR